MERKDLGAGFEILRWIVECQGMNLRWLGYKSEETGSTGEAVCQSQVVRTDSLQVPLRSLQAMENRWHGLFKHAIVPAW